MRRIFFDFDSEEVLKILAINRGYRGLMNESVNIKIAHFMDYNI